MAKNVNGVKWSFCLISEDSLKGYFKIAALILLLINVCRLRLLKYNESRYQGHSCVWSGGRITETADDGNIMGWFMTDVPFVKVNWGTETASGQIYPHNTKRVKHFLTILHFSPHFCRHAPCREPMYYANTGYAMAPATSANDSEQQSMSSDAETVSLTDSSVYVFSDLTQIYTHTHKCMHTHSLVMKLLNRRSYRRHKSLAGTKEWIIKIKDKT